MTDYGFGQRSTFLMPQGAGVLGMQSNPAFIGLPEMPTAKTTEWIMEGLLGPTQRNTPSLMGVMGMAGKPYQGVPWGNEPLSNGPEQWRASNLGTLPTTQVAAPNANSPSSNPSAPQDETLEVNGPWQRIALPTTQSLPPIALGSVTSSQTKPPTVSPSTIPKSENQSVTLGQKPNKIPQWAWDATRNIKDSKARVAIAHVLLKECSPKNIHKVVNHPKDPGGVTKYGIAQKYNLSVDVASLSIEEAAKIYYNQYWKPNQSLLNQYGAGMDVAIMDAIVHHGAGGTKKLLRKIEGTPTPQLLAKARLTSLQAKDHAGSFIEGWTTRIDDVTAFAESMG